MKKNMKVLVVDNNKEGRLLLSKILTSNNLIISDILRPVMDGFTLIRELNKDNTGGKIPVVLYSAQYVNEKDKELAEKLGALRFTTENTENNCNSVISANSVVYDDHFDLENYLCG